MGQVRVTGIGGGSCQNLHCVHQWSFLDSNLENVHSRDLLTTILISSPTARYGILFRISIRLTRRYVTHVYLIASQKCSAEVGGYGVTDCP